MARGTLAGHSTARTLAVLVGPPPAALALGLALSLWLPISPHARVEIGMYSVFPVWCTLVCVALLARSGKVAWAGLGLVFVIASVAVWLAR